MSTPEEPKKSPKSPERQCQERARAYYEPLMEGNYDLFAAARLALSLENLFIFAQSDEYLETHHIDFRMAQEMLAKIESGLLRGFFTLEDLKIQPAEFLAFCRRFHYCAVYMYCFLPEVFGLSNGVELLCDLPNHPGYKLFLKAFGRIDEDHYRPYWELTSFLVLPNGSRDSLGTVKQYVMSAPEDALEEYASRIGLIAQMKIQMGALPLPDEDLPH